MKQEDSKKLKAKQKQLVVFYLKVKVKCLLRCGTADYIFLEQYSDIPLD